MCWAIQFVPLFPVLITRPDRPRLRPAAPSVEINCRPGARTRDCNFGKNALFIDLNNGHQVAHDSLTVEISEFTMLSAEQNDRLTRVGPGKPSGAALRRYWQPAALADELDGQRPVKPVKLQGEDLVIFRDDKRR